LETISTTSQNNQVQEDISALEELKARYTEVKSILDDRATIWLHVRRPCANDCLRETFYTQNHANFLFAFMQNLWVTAGCLFHVLVISKLELWQAEASGLESWLEKWTCSCAQKPQLLVTLTCWTLSWNNQM